MTGRDRPVLRYAIQVVAAIVLVACARTLADYTSAAQRGGAGSVPVGQSGDWELVFSDEFNGEDLDRSRWVRCHWWNDDGCTIETNHELQWYRPENVAVRDGRLVLQATERNYRASDGRVYAYTSGMVSTGQDAYRSSTPHRFADTFFYAEIRARIPTGRGLWPALWLLPASNTHPPEIDIMEAIGQAPRELQMTVHFRDRSGKIQNIQDTWTSRAPLDDWHTYAVDWRPDSITWYIDGRPLAAVTSPRIAIPQEPMYFVANLAVGGDWPGPPDTSTVFPAVFELDFVRIWKRAR